MILDIPPNSLFFTMPTDIKKIVRSYTGYDDGKLLAIIDVAFVRSRYDLLKSSVAERFYVQDYRVTVSRTVKFLKNRKYDSHATEKKIFNLTIDHFCAYAVTPCKAIRNKRRARMLYRKNYNLRKRVYDRMKNEK